LSHLAIDYFFITFRINLIHLASRGRNVDKEVCRPISLCTSFKFYGFCKSRMVAHLSGLASIPRAVSMNPRNFPVATPNTSLVGFNLLLYLQIWLITSMRASTWLRAPRFDHHVVHVNLYSTTYLLLKDFFHKPLIGGPCIFQLEWHNLIIIVNGFADKSRLFLIWMIHGYLVVARIGMQKVEHLMAERSINQLINAWRSICVFRACLV